eukprot:CAMPEP_0173440784 /NCGR_PEP_ID=MMETSP1357-20121228/23609_1 /TAXON_ID=77926 /ORGANISM="Hemiselmis rufescens, Strain PCC563" /LENGTH=110 /DNA_ID=CAMNT_0014406321 /DNA_START=38 /DNA_END=366 /DNA_ORIENTATION=-
MSDNDKQEALMTHVGDKYTPLLLSFKHNVPSFRELLSKLIDTAATFQSVPSTSSLPAPASTPVAVQSASVSSLQHTLSASGRILCQSAHIGKADTSCPPHLGRVPCSVGA